MISSAPESSIPAMASVHFDEATLLVAPTASARFQCALYLEFLHLAALVLKQYSRRHLSQG